MPWKECHTVDERGRFVARLMDGESMTALCEEFGISRKTGYKIAQRYQRTGVRGLTDRSWRPYRHANQLPRAVETLIVRLKRDYPMWGAPKIRERRRQRWPETLRARRSVRCMRCSAWSPNVLQQQVRFDTFVHRFNHERPHQALDMATPASCYRPSTRRYAGVEELEYPFHDWTAVVTHCGRICYQRRKINLSQVFAGQKVGVKQTDEHIWLVTFMDYDLGYFDDETCRLEPVADPFGPRLSPMSPE